MNTRIAYIFPGQASQYAGMGRDLSDNYAAAREVFEEADAALGFSISEMCFGGSAEATIGNFNAHGLAASVTGPLFGSETLAARLYVAARERDGYNDVVTGKGPSKRDQDADQGFYTVRGQLLFVPDDKATFKLIGDYTKRDENCCGAVQIRTGPTAGILALLNGGPALATTAPRPVNEQDGYVFAYGQDYARALKELSVLTGPTKLLPQWTYGVWY